MREDNKPMSSVADEPAAVNEARREFLLKCGRFAAYTTPVVIALLCHDEKTAQASLSPPGT